MKAYVHSCYNEFVTYTGLLQESFELNHETLYLAVKIIDLYLARVVIQRDYLQLIGSTAIFIACKFDVSVVARREILL